MAVVYPGHFLPLFFSRIHDSRDPRINIILISFWIVAVVFCGSREKNNEAAIYSQLYGPSYFKRDIKNSLENKLMQPSTLRSLWARGFWGITPLGTVQDRTASLGQGAASLTIYIKLTIS